MPTDEPTAAPLAIGDEQEVKDATVLIVDDNEQNLELLHAYIEEGVGCRVRTASDGIEALRLVESEPPDIILLDVMMPRMSGFQVCSRLKNDPATRDIPVLMVTALNEVADVERAVESGADDFLTKPVHRIELVTRVKSLLRVRLLRKQLEKTMDEVRRLSGGEPGA